jgi:hypothetical protein
MDNAAAQRLRRESLERYLRGTTFELGKRIRHRGWPCRQSSRLIQQPERFVSQPNEPLLGLGARKLTIRRGQSVDCVEQPTLCFQRLRCDEPVNVAHDRSPLRPGMNVTLSNAAKPFVPDHVPARRSTTGAALSTTASGTVQYDTPQRSRRSTSDSQICSTVPSQT